MASFDEDAILYDLNILLEWSTEQEEDAVRDQLQRHPFTGQSWSKFAIKRMKSFLGRSSNTADVFIRLHCVSSGVLVSFSPKERFLLTVRGATIDLYEPLEPSLDQPTLTLRLPLTETFPQWLKAAWSDTGNHFALSGPALGIHVYSIRGALVASIKPSEEQAVNLDDVLVTALALRELTTNSDHLLLSCFHFSGRIANFDIDLEAGTGMCVPISSLHLAERVPLRLLCAETGFDSDVLVLGTTAFALTTLSPSTQRGLLFLRRINESPHFQLTPVCEKDFALLNRQNFLSRIMLGDAADAVCHLSLGPHQQKLAALHTSGAISLWSFPSGQLLHMLYLRLQPFHEAMSPLLSERVFSSWARRVLPCLPSNRPTCLTWWDNESLVVSRENGSVAVWSRRFESRTGDRPEWFEPYVQLPAGCGRAEGQGFFLLDCDSRRRRPRRNSSGGSGEEESPAVDISADDEEEEEEDDEGDREEGFLWFALRRGGTAVKRAMGWGGAPRGGAKKRRRLVETTYRLIRFSSTTPEQLFHRKIEAEEYGEALALSRRYPGLDPDLVLQRQWHRSQMSRAAIEDFLMRIGKHSWVLHECLERVPDDLDSMRSLLDLGLRATDVDAFVAAANSAESGRLVLTDPSMMLEGGDWTASTADETARSYRSGKLVELEKILGGRLSWEKLSLQQHELLRQRQRLLDILDRLDAFEEVLGGKHRAPDRYVAETFAKFRAVDPLRAAVDFARDTNLLGLEVMLSHFWPRLGPHWLLLLANIPETESPRLYEQLLPRPGQRLDGEEVLPWDPVLRDPDWSEDLLTDDTNGEAVSRTADLLYAESPALVAFRTANLTQSLLTDWFLQRATEMERRAGQVCWASELLVLGRQLGVTGLETLANNLDLLATLVYECGVADPRLSLAVLETLSRLERLRLMMSVTTAGDGERFVRVLARWAVPFLEQATREKPTARWPTLRQFLVEHAAISGGLADVRALFEAVARDSVRVASLCGAAGPEEVAHLSEAGVECCYACPEDDQLTQALGLVAALAKLRGGATPSETFRRLEKHIEGAAILERCHHARPLSFFRKHDQTPNSHAVDTIMRSIVAKRLREPVALASREVDALLVDLRVLLTRALPSDRPGGELAARAVVEGLLRCGATAGLSLASRYMQLTPDQAAAAGTPARLPFDEAAEVAAAAAAELFDTATSASDGAACDARACLSLLKAPHPALTKELHLAEGVALLADLGASLLPVEVRRHPDRAALLRRCLRAKPSLLHHRDRVVRAGIALDIAGKDSEPAALCLLADAALEQRELEMALVVALRLAQHFAFPPAWRQCEQVAELAAGEGVSAKRWRALIDFAMAHCPAAELTRLTITSARLESAALRRRSSANPSAASGGQLVDSLRRAANLLRPLHKGGAGDPSEDVEVAFLEEKNEDDDDDDVLELKKTWVTSPFFEPSSRQHGAAVSKLLRCVRLEEAAEGAAALCAWEPLFFQLAKAAQGSDSVLFLAAAARVSSPSLLDRLASRFPESGPNYDLVLRAICLALLLRQEVPVFVESPLEELCSKVKDQSDVMSAEEVALFEKFFSRRCDYRQGQRLLALVPDLSLRRFTDDGTYREQTVLGLAMAETVGQYELATELAERYNIPRWDLRSAHLEFLLTESSSEPAVVAARIEALALASDLLSVNRDRFLTVMKDRIWPLLSGTEHARLELFLSLLPPEVLLAGLSVGEHIKVLRKLRAAAPGVDYKALATTDGSDPLRTLALHLNSGNVHVFAKLACNWRSAQGEPLKGSSIFSLWTGRLFWQQEQKGNGDWVHRFEQCGPFFPRLLPVDFLSFVREAVFSPASRQINLEARQDILRRAGKLCRQQAGGGGAQGKGKRRKAADDEGESFRWSDAAAAVSDYLSHVDLTADVLFPRLRSLGIEEAELAPFEVLPPGTAFLEQVFTQLLLWKVAASSINELAEELGADQDVVAAAVCAAAQQVVVAGLADLGVCQQDLSVLLERAADLMTCLDGRAAVLGAVKALLVEPDIRSRLGLFLVQLLRSYNDGSEDVAAAVVSQAVCVLQEFFEDQEWDAESLAADPEARLALVTNLVEMSDSVETLRAIHEALEILGHVDEDGDSRLWSTWVRRAVDFRELDNFVIDIFTRRCGPSEEVDEKCLEAIKETMKVYKDADGRVSFVLCLLSGREDLVSDADTRALLSPEVCASLNENQQPLLQRLLERGWLHHVVGTDLYGSCVDLLLGNDNSPLVNRVVRDLREEGFFLEASSLLADSQHLHPGLRTFSVLSSLWGKFAGK